MKAKKLAAEGNTDAAKTFTDMKAGKVSGRAAKKTLDKIKPTTRTKAGTRTKANGQVKTESLPDIIAIQNPMGGSSRGLFIVIQDHKPILTVERAKLLLGCAEGNEESLKQFVRLEWIHGEPKPMEMATDTTSTTAGQVDSNLPAKYAKKAERLRQIKQRAAALLK